MLKLFLVSVLFQHLALSLSCHNSAFSLCFASSAAYAVHHVRLNAPKGVVPQDFTPLMGNSQNKSNVSAFGFESEPLLNDLLWN